MKQTPHISIITSTYNAANFLEDSIKSILNQKYSNFEYIVIDGASKDGTVDIIKKYEKVISYWVSEPDSGIYEAWNKGILAAKGDWILFLGADDQLLPETLEVYVDYINSNSTFEYDYISSRIKRVNLDGSLENTVGKAWKWKEFKQKMTVAHPGSFHSRKLFEKYGNYNTNYKIVSDYELLLRPKDKLKAGFINKVTVLMLTGSRFTDLEALSECLLMQKKSGIISLTEYLFRYPLMLIKYLIKRI